MSLLSGEDEKNVFLILWDFLYLESKCNADTFLTRARLESVRDPECDS